VRNLVKGIRNERIIASGQKIEGRVGTNPHRQQYTKQTGPNLASDDVLGKEGEPFLVVPTKTSVPDGDQSSVATTRKVNCTFPHRLSPAIRRLVNALAEQEGISINLFICLAVAEKISRLEWHFLSGGSAKISHDQQPQSLALTHRKERRGPHPSLL
jgi:hypothetical protein